MNWEGFYKENEANWGFEPSISAIVAANLFSKHHIKKVLIPGVGYGRNTKPFLEAGMDITGIEISETAIRLARNQDLNFPIYKGSITEMPFNNEAYDGIFCYATLHLFGEKERKKIVKKCYSQLRKGGILYFNVVSKEAMKDFDGEIIDFNTMKLKNGFKVFFYDLAHAKEEFNTYNIKDIVNIHEPIKHKPEEKALPCINIICRKI